MGAVGRPRALSLRVPPEPLGVATDSFPQSESNSALSRQYVFPSLKIFRHFAFKTRCTELPVWLRLNLREQGVQVFAARLLNNSQEFHVKTIHVFVFLVDVLLVPGKAEKCLGKFGTLSPTGLREILMEQASLLGNGAQQQAGGYAGDVTAVHAWERLRSDPGAMLVDVRTRAEWNFVGVPDLSELGKEVVFVEWQSYPAMEINPAFVDAVSAAASDRRAPLYLLCRSGARSRAAAVALTGAGHAECYNVSGGFEGPHDAQKHRGVTDGWKASRLPWVQG